MRKRGWVRKVGRVVAVLFAAGFAVRRLPLPDAARRSSAAHGQSGNDRVHGAARARGAGERRRAAEVQRWVPYGRISRNLKRAVLVAEDSGFWQHEGIEFEQMKESMEVEHRTARVRARRQHDHPAAGEEPVSVAVEEPDPEAAGDSDRAPARGGADQTADPRALSERDRVGRRDLRRGGGGAHLLRQVRGRARSLRKSALLAGAIVNPRVLTPGASHRAAAAAAADDHAAHGGGDAASGRGRGAGRQTRRAPPCRCPLHPAPALPAPGAPAGAAGESRCRRRRRSSPPCERPPCG